MTARAEYRKAVKAMMDAKTAAEMTASWKELKPRDKAAKVAPQAEARPGSGGLQIYVERKPEMVANVHRQYAEILNRGILEPKTTFLIMIACYMMGKHYGGVFPQACNAKAAGATEEEIMEVAAVLAYAKAKMNAVETGDCLAEVFENPGFKSTIRVKE